VAHGGQPATDDANADWRFAHRELLEQILQEARDRRASGDLPESFERELDAAFEQLVPHERIEDPGALIEQVERLSRIDPGVPALSGIPGGAAAKRTVRRLMFWYVNFVTDQVQEFAHATTRVLRLLDHRISRLETRVGTADPQTLARLGPLPAGTDVEPWADEVLRRLGDPTGRVLHAECGRGGLLERLRDAGIDGYGVEPRIDAADAAALAGLEVRHEGVVEHLDTVADRALAGAVLNGAPDTLSLPAKVRLVESAARTIRPGGHLLVVTAQPDSWGRGRTAVLADLSPDGRPLHPETWVQLLGVNGFTEVIVDDRGDADSFLLAAIRDGE
jgi:SAM-dependent methyltransferase